MRWIVILVLLSTLVSAQYISDYPSVFSDAEIIIGDVRFLPEEEAKEMTFEGMAHVQYSGFSRYTTPDVLLASHVPQINTPTVLVGTPCGNQWIQRVMNEPHCNFIDGTTALVQFTRYNDQPVLIITGGSPQMVYYAALWLHERGQSYRGTWARLRAAYQRGYQIGNGDRLTLGRKLGDVTPAIVGPSQTVRYTSANSYLRFDKSGGKVIFGERD